MGAGGLQPLPATAFEGCSGLFSDCGGAAKGVDLRDPGGVKSPLGGSQAQLLGVTPAWAPILTGGILAEIM